MAARTSGVASHRGTALPGLVGEWIWPAALRVLAGQLERTVLVIGTNGKTTTAGLIADIVQGAGHEPIANRSGANMRQGIVSSLLREADMHGRLRRDGRRRRLAVFEVDELALERILPEVGPAVIVATNLFRDQVDRYGEADGIIDRWTAALSNAAPGTILVHCADDPRLSMLAAASPLPKIAFGLAEPPMNQGRSSDADGSVGDPVACRACGRQVVYSWRSIGHLGGFACPEGHVRRVEPAVFIDPWVPVERPHRLRIGGRFGEATARPIDDGLTGAYNVAAALAVGAAIGQTIGQACDAIEASGRPFGRLEWLEIEGRHVILALIKNTVSLAETVYMSPSWAADAVLLGLSDAPADGRDISWIWDAPIAALVADRAVVLTGSRDSDLRLRIKYDPDVAAAPPRSLQQVPNLARALDLALAEVPIGGRLVVAATYTAMMGLRVIAERRGDAPPVPR